jgi:cellulose biosynthesis protein BcsQ
MTATRMSITIDSTGLRATAHTDRSERGIALTGADESTLMTAVFEYAHRHAVNTDSTVVVDIHDERAPGSDTAPQRLEVDPDNTIRPVIEPFESTVHAHTEQGTGTSTRAGAPRQPAGSAQSRGPVVRVVVDAPPADLEQPPPQQRIVRPSETPAPAPQPTRGHPALRTSTRDALSPTPPSGTRSPARRGVRGRLNAALGLKLAARVDELGVRTAASTIAGPVPDHAVVAVINVKGGVGKTPITLGLASQLAAHRGPGTTAAVDLGESNNSFADRIAAPAPIGFDTAGLLDLIESTGGQITPATLGRYLVRQPSGEDVLTGRDDERIDLGYEQAQALGSLLSRFRDLLIVDTGNAENSGRWQWAVGTAQVVLIPVPLRADVVAVARRMVGRIAARRPHGLTGVMVVITDGPGDTPDIEAGEIEQLTRGDGIDVVLRMPYEPVFASGQPITADDLALPTRDALTRLGARVITAMSDGGRTR